MMHGHTEGIGNYLESTASQCRKIYLHILEAGEIKQCLRRVIEVLILTQSEIRGSRGDLTTRNQVEL